MTHQLPGFSNPRVLTNLRFSPDSIPYSLYLNFDKTAAGILLLGWCHARLRTARDWGVMLRAMLPWALGILLVMAVMAALTGYFRFDPKAPPPALLWMWANLCFTCVAEEALFRGFIQAQLQRLFRPLAGGQWIALAIAAAAFGLAHSNGGAMYVLLSTLAGLGYGWVYQRTRRIEASILLHFSLNTAHFFLMSYPALQR
jgi:membrane protease YdiL (CAAX protease family)